MNLNKMHMLAFLIIISCNQFRPIHHKWDSAIEIIDIAFWPPQGIENTIVIPISSCSSCSNHIRNIIERVRQNNKLAIVITGFESLKDVRLLFTQREVEEYELIIDTLGSFSKVIAEDPNTPWLIIKTAYSLYYKVAFTNQNYAGLIGKLLNKPPAYNYNEVDTNPFYKTGIDNFRDKIDSTASTVGNLLQNDSWLHFDVDTTGKIEFVRIKPSSNDLVQQKFIHLFEQDTNWISGKMNGKKIITAIKLKIN